MTAFPTRNRKLENLCYTCLFWAEPGGEKMSVIRSSDIGNYLYCRRAWWYRRQGIESENQAELATGTEIHRQHGRKVLAATLNRFIGMVLLFIVLILLIAYCTSQIL